MASLRLISVLALACLAMAGSAVGADDLPVNEPTGFATGGTTGGGQQALTGFFSSGRTPYEFWLTVLIIAFGLLTLGIVLATFRKSVRIYAEQLLRFATVLIIVVGTLVLITAGYNNEQVAPAFGLFGTIVGYILGRMSQPPAPEPPEAAPAPPASGVRA